MPAQDTERTTYDRQVLYEEVWAEPAKVVAASYGVSDVALAKACRRLAVPLPGRGFWAKKKAGKEVSARPPLPDPPPGVPNQILVSGEARRRSGVSSPPAKEGGRREAKPEIRVPTALMSPHPLVAEAKALLKGPGPRDEMVSCSAKKCLDIMVTRGLLPRALRIMDALVKALEEGGHRVEATEPRPSTGSYYGGRDVMPGVTRVLIGEDWVHFSLNEKRTQVMETRRTDWGHTWQQRAYPPTGALSLSITNAWRFSIRRTWSDGKRQRVEDCLGDFVSYLPVVAEELKGQRLEEERREQERLEAERRWEEAEERRMAEERRVKDLLDQLKRWRLARDIRAYVEEVSRRSLGTSEDLAWALGYADTIDPIH